MTTITTHGVVTADHPQRARTPFDRVFSVVKLQLANPWTAIVTPWMILGIIFLANVLIWVIINATSSGKDLEDARQGLSYSGASFYIFVYMLVMAIQMFSITFRFALGLGVTRRDYWLGTALTFVIVAAMFAIGITILGVIERATNGWGLGGRMFSPVYFGEEWWQRLLAIFFGLLFFLFFGSLCAAVYVRWKATGMIVLFGGLGLLIVAGVAWFSFTHTWNSFGDVFAGATALSITSWLLIPAVIAGTASFFVLRRATARA
jgi:hypothetical protein